MKKYSMFYNWIYWLEDCDLDKARLQLLRMLWTGRVVSRTRHDVYYGTSIKNMIEEGI